MDVKILTATDLGNVIRQARKSQKLTQDDLAGMTGNGRRFISDLENGKPTMHFGKILGVLATLGISLKAFSQWHIDK